MNKQSTPEVKIYKFIPVLLPDYNGDSSKPVVRIHGVRGRLEELPSPPTTETTLVQTAQEVLRKWTKKEGESLAVSDMRVAGMRNIICAMEEYARQSIPVSVQNEYILCAATWYKELPLIKPEVLQPRGFAPYNVDRGIVFCGWRHPNCLYQKVAITGLADSASGEHEQGFLTNKNRFVDREEAATIATASGQIKETKRTLFSEDLY